jgi:hypothetical protein
VSFYIGQQRYGAIKNKRAPVARTLPKIFALIELIDCAEKNNMRVKSIAPEKKKRMKYIEIKQANIFSQFHCFNHHLPFVALPFLSLYYDERGYISVDSLRDSFLRNLGIFYNPIVQKQQRHKYGVSKVQACYHDPLLPF